MGTRDLLAAVPLICVGSVFLLATSCQSFRFVDTIPPQTLTETRLLFTHHRIQHFWNEHGKVPDKLSDLPNETNRDCSVTDGWGRSLHWESDGKFKVRVWSLGRDGEPKGAGEDTDLEVDFVGKEKLQNDIPRIKRGTHHRE